MQDTSSRIWIPFPWNDAMKNTRSCAPDETHKDKSLCMKTRCPWRDAEYIFLSIDHVSFMWLTEDMAPFSIVPSERSNSNWWTATWYIYSFIQKLTCVCGVKITKEQAECAATTKYPQSLLYSSVKVSQKILPWLAEGHLQPRSGRWLWEAMTMRLVWLSVLLHMQAMQPPQIWPPPTEVEDCLPRSPNNQVAFQGTLRIQ